MGFLAAAWSQSATYWWPLCPTLSTQKQCQKGQPWPCGKNLVASRYSHPRTESTTLLVPCLGKLDRKPGMVTHVCNSSIWKQQMDRFELEARLGHRVSARPARAIELCSKQKKTSKMGMDSGDSGETERKESMVIWAGWPLTSSFAVRLTKKQTKQTMC